MMEKLRSMDDAFRRQLESMLAAHQAELVQLANEKEKQIVAANEKVIENANNVQLFSSIYYMLSKSICLFCLLSICQYR